jgi:hypothetical protein
MSEHISRRNSASLDAVASGTTALVSWAARSTTAISMKVQALQGNVKRLPENGRYT